MTRLTINGQNHEIEVEPATPLLWAIREQVGLTGTKYGCGAGICGACTVRIDGMLARSCLTLAVQVEGATVDTVEGVAPAPGRLSVLQDAFRKHHALQCGFCTAGIVMSLDTLLRDAPDADEARIRDVLSGHLCRCTGYHAIVQAALEAAETLRKETDHA